MRQRAQSRREFLRSSGTLFSGSWLSVNLPLVLAVAQTACSKRESGAAWVNLNAAEAAGLGGVADQIIPPDETAGAVDAGVVHFIDSALNEFMAGALPMLQEGLRDLDAQAGGDFATLAFDQQTALLKNIEETPFFGAMQFLTMVGMFAMSEYGGNRDGAGWQLIGFDHRHAWQPPFGYYDEQYAAAEDDHVQS